MRALIAVLFFTGLFLSGLLFARQDHGDHATADVGTDYAARYSGIMARMHAEMGAPPTGDADFDFATGMIPHHRAAVEMAQLQLDFGTDPVLRALAEEIIAAQEAEIALLEDWLDGRTPAR